MGARRSRPPFANAWFFPAAALYAAVLLPLSVLSMLGLMPALPGLVSPAGHAHEMLYGFALAVVAGYLLGPQPRETTLILLGCWRSEERRVGKAGRERGRHDSDT